MKEKFTSGEWAVAEDIMGEFSIEANLDENGFYDLICDGVGEKANAHLMAQSKNMYRLLKRLERWGDIGNETLKGEIGPLLAKARGE